MDRLLEVARFTLREGRCGLCGSDALTPVTGGFRCECGAISLTSRPGPQMDAERAEDEAQMRDFQAAERSTGYRDRSRGG